MASLLSKVPKRHRSFRSMRHSPSCPPWTHPCPPWTRTLALYIVKNATSRCVQIPRRRSCSSSYTHSGTLPALAVLKPRCQHGLQKTGKDDQGRLSVRERLAQAGYITIPLQNRASLDELGHEFFVKFSAQQVIDKVPRSISFLTERLVLENKVVVPSALHSKRAGRGRVEAPWRLS